MLKSASGALGVLRRAWPILKWMLFLGVLGAVALQARHLWAQVQRHDAVIDPQWLALAVLAYLVGWLPAVWYWKNLLVRMGEKVTWLQVLRAYFCGHLGKYVPGKAGVILIRMGLLQQTGVRPHSAALSATYESLLSMAAGAVTGIALVPWVFSDETLHSWFRGALSPTLAKVAIPLVVFAACLLGLSLLTWIINLLVRRLQRVIEPGSEGQPPFDFRPSFAAFLLLIAGWWFHGLSLGFTIRSISSAPLDLRDWPSWTAGASLATVLGFLAVFTPGGMGVREWALMEIFGPELGFRAVLVACLLRIVWLAGETGAAAGLYYAVSIPRKGSAH